MNTTAIIPVRAEALLAGKITLDHGSHVDFAEGHCSMEVVAWLAGEGFTDAPACASPVLTRYTIALNDQWDNEKRQRLAPYLPRMVGTGNDGLDGARERIAMDYLTGRTLGPWLRLAGMDAEADRLSGLSGRSYAEQKQVVRAIRDRAWEVRGERRQALRAKIEAELKAKGKPAAVAAAVAAATAATAAAAAAATATVAAATAAAVAAAAAVAVAVADAVAAAVADAVAAAVAAGDSYEAAYQAARAYYRNRPEIFADIHALAKAQEPLALELLDAMINPNAETTKEASK